VNAPRGILTLIAAILPTTGGAQLDSQVVLQHYALALSARSSPKVVVYSYAISQVGPSNIEQRHRIYRSGLNVRDETLSVDGIPLSRKLVRFSRREDRYAVERFAPSAGNYELLFLGTAKDAHHLDYVYEATPIGRTSGAWVDRLTIDGVTFLPRFVHFHSSGVGVVGSGNVEFGSFGKYWMPLLADASARVGGKVAHERISWSDYRFPKSLPPSTFAPPRPLPHATIPTI
jgi:hypothetical protein